MYAEQRLSIKEWAEDDRPSPLGSARDDNSFETALDY
jgi:hypothetical protein